MGQLKNIRHERFARAYVREPVAYRAYWEAGYKAHGTPTPAFHAPAAAAGASRLLKKTADRIGELRMGIQTRADATEDRLIAELDETRGIALEAGQCGPAVQATVVKAKIAGALVERKEIGSPGDFSKARNREELQRLLIERLGESDAAALLKAFQPKPIAKP